MKKLILLDNGHGKETPGKRSPIWGDGSQLFEWEFNRDIVKRIAKELDKLGILYKIIVPEQTDISLPERCSRANAFYKQNNDCVLFSIHANAGGGTGWECYTTVGVTQSDKIATVLCDEAKREFSRDGWQMRFDQADGDPDKESQFYILANTNCPAVLSENFFMDTEKDCKFIMSEAGRERVAKVHVEAIKKLI